MNFASRKPKRLVLKYEALDLLHLESKMSLLLMSARIEICVMLLQCKYF
jgi:hypothetical protein